MRSRKWAIIITAAVTAAVLLGAFGVKQVVAKPTAYGTCNTLTSTCTNVPVDTLELVAGYRWVASSTKVLESKANLRSGFNTVEVVTGVIEFQGGSEGMSLGDGSSWPAPKGPASTEDGEAVLRRLGAKKIETLRNRDTLVVMRGLTAHSQLVYVSAIVNE